MISVVQKLDGYHFRSRAQEALNYLAFLMRDGHDIKVLKSYEGSDYQWRIIMGKRPARIAFGKLFDDLTYDNFKNEAGGSEGYGDGELWNVYHATERAHHRPTPSDLDLFADTEDVKTRIDQDRPQPPPHGLDCSGYSDGMTAADWDRMEEASAGGEAS